MRLLRCLRGAVLGEGIVSFGATVGVTGWRVGANVSEGAIPELPM